MFFRQNGQLILCAATAFLLLSSNAYGADPDSLADLIEKVEPSIVRIDSNRSTGSGFLIAEGGLVATNCHVMTGVTEATVTFKTNDKANVTGTLLLDESRDIAIIKIDKNPTLPVLPLADKLPRKGDSVSTFGAPEGLSFSASDGIVSAIRKGTELTDAYSALGIVRHRDGTWIQTTAPISHGNSGGPLVSREGKVVAMNTLLFPGAQNVNFAISSLDIADDLQKSKGQPLAALAKRAADTVLLPQQDSDKLTALKSSMIKNVKEALKTATEKEMARIKTGDLSGIYLPMRAVSIQPWSVAHLKGSAIAIQILDDGLLLEIDGVICKELLIDSSASELRAKVGAALPTTLSIDTIFVVGAPKDYVKVGGSSGSYFPLVPAEFAIGPDELKVLVQAEHARREEERQSQRRDMSAQVAAQLKHTFTDTTGQFTAEAVAIALNGTDGTIELIKTKDNSRLTVRIARLSDADQHWIRSHLWTITNFGADAATQFQNSPAHSSHKNTAP